MITIKIIIIIILLLMMTQIPAEEIIFDPKKDYLGEGAFGKVYKGKSHHLLLLLLLLLVLLNILT